jgi:hypothetical protein
VEQYGDPAPGAEAPEASGRTRKSVGALRKGKNETRGSKSLQKAEIPEIAVSKVSLPQIRIIDSYETSQLFSTVDSYEQVSNRENIQLGIQVGGEIDILPSCRVGPRSV